MLTTFETKSARVKGLSFHPQRPWIITSLHSGVIQLWDYRMCTLLEKYFEHEGPVRGLDFHKHQSLFVSGGDDFKIKLWNYKLKKCVFTLTAHLDYIRTTVFHHVYPWILSASDDQTVRIWNWQSRECLSILTGHSHYVMCALFHPKEDAVISASLDQTIRIWDISNLKQKGIKGPGNTDLFGQAAAVVKLILEGHDRGVNWACFHHKLPLIVSCADDRHVKIWRVNGGKVWEVDTFRGHYNNVSCVLFHPRKDLIISNSEDKSVRVWDIASRTCLQTLRRDQDRFWTLNVHPTENLFAAGHDSGMIMFKLHKERPAHTVINNYVFYLKDGILRKLNLQSSIDTPVAKLRGGTKGYVTNISLNSAEDTLLVSATTVNNDIFYYDTYTIPKECKDGVVLELEYKRSAGSTALWFSRNKFAVLDKNTQMSIKNAENVAVKKIHIPHSDRIHSCLPGMIMLSESEHLIMYDVNRKFIKSRMRLSNCKYVVWSSDLKYAAILSKNGLTISNQNLDKLHTIIENNKVKSGAWIQNCDVFIYSTRNHIKYLMINGDGGIVRTLNCHVYIIHANDDRLLCLDRDSKPKLIHINNTEYKFKMALENRDYGEIMRTIRSSNLIGQAIIAYLQSKGHPEIALHFIKDNRTVFELALESCEVDKAMDAALAINEDTYWMRLADMSMLLGNNQIAELCYQRCRNFSKLSFLYIITGNFEKLRKMNSISHPNNDHSSKFQRVLLLDDLEGRVNLLRENKMNFLAELTLAVHSPSEDATALTNQAKLFQAPPAIIKENNNWPLINMGISAFSENRFTCIEDDLNDNRGWNDEESDTEGSNAKDAQTEGWDISEEININCNDELVLTSIPTDLQTWLINTNQPIYHILAGSYKTAAKLLHNQIGVVDFKPYYELFQRIFMSSKLFLDTQTYVLQPKSLLNLNDSAGNIQLMMQTTTDGKFKETVELARSLIVTLTLTIVEKKWDEKEVVKRIQLCREYILALSMETFRKTLPKITVPEQKRQCELVAYLTHCKLQLPHQILTLRTALSTLFKYQYYSIAISVANRLLQLSPKPEIASQARKILHFCQSNQPKDVQELDAYDELNPFSVCGYSFRAIRGGEPLVKCPLCDSSFLPEFRGHLCNVCELAEIGLHCIGLNISSQQYQ